MKNTKKDKKPYYTVATLREVAKVLGKGIDSKITRNQISEKILIVKEDSFKDKIEKLKHVEDLLKITPLSIEQGNKQKKITV